jgi:hypothetical protein
VEEGDDKSPACSNYLNNTALLKPTAVQQQRSSGIAAKSMGKALSDLDSSAGVSQDTTSNNLSSHRLESMADLQHEGREIQNLWKNLDLHKYGRNTTPQIILRDGL